MKLNDILAKRIGPLNLGGWLGIFIAIVAAGVVRSYVWPEKTNGNYLRELVENGTVQQTATSYIASIKKANAAAVPTEADWAQVEKGLSQCLVKQANTFLASGDPYLSIRADKTTPAVLAKRFLDACDGTGLVARASGDSRGARQPAESIYEGLEPVQTEASTVPSPHRADSAQSIPRWAQSPLVNAPREAASAIADTKPSGGIPAPSLDDLKAATQGDPVAQYLAGVRFSLRESPDDIKQAISWFEKAAKQGHSGAQYELGASYYRGYGVPKDVQQAVTWFQKSAEQGDPSAQYDMGLVYYRGEGVTQDFVEAHKWWNVAGSRGDQKARDRREMVEQRMTREKIAEAQRRASEWMKANK